MAAPLLRRALGGAEALRPTGDEDEVARRGGGGDQAVPLIVHEQPAIETFAHVDAAPGVGPAVGTARDLDPPRAEPDGVVAGHHAGIAAAQPVREIAGRPAPRGHGLGGGVGEAAVVVGEIGGQVGLGRGHGVDPVEVQLGDEPILEGGPEPFDAALRLGRVGGDVADAEIPQDLAELGGMLSSLQLFLETPVGIVADEDAEAIPVEGHGQAVPRGQLLEQREIAMQVLGGPEVEREDGAGGVVDGAEQEPGRPRAQPVERAAVDEDEVTHGRVPGAAGSVLGGPAAPLRGQAEGPPEAADGFAADREAFDLTELLGAVTVIELTVGGLDQFPHAIPELALQRPGRGPAPQAMHQPPDALGPIPRREAPELPWGHVEGIGPGARR